LLLSSCARATQQSRSPAVRSRCLEQIPSPSAGRARRVCPYVFDFATSVAAGGELELHRRAGKLLPEGWAIDATGESTSDPQAALDGAMLSFGGHKQSAIGTMIELLAGIMTGDLTSPEVLEYFGTTTLAPMHGELVIAFSPEAFSAGRAGDPFAAPKTCSRASLAREPACPHCAAL
jgi:delta1-piperideine-2-carboxylate reductase